MLVMAPKMPEKAMTIMESIDASWAAAW